MSEDRFEIDRDSLNSWLQLPRETQDWLIKTSYGLVQVPSKLVIYSIADSFDSDFIFEPEASNLKARVFQKIRAKRNSYKKGLRLIS